jgi:hypothetical protein
MKLKKVRKRRRRVRRSSFDLVKKERNGRGSENSDLK